MAYSVTYTFTNGSTADGTQVNTNFQDGINASSDGTEDFSISALTCAGAATFNGNVTLGNGTVDDITFTGSLASSIPIKTTFSYDVGIATVGIKSIYFGDDGSAARTTRVIGGTVASSHTITLMEDGGTAGYAVETNGSGVLSYGLKMRVGDTHNIGFAAATTTSAADSIKIQGAAAALSATNPGYLCLPNATAGLVSVFKITADVTIDLTGAHWGEGTKGDLTDYLLSIYAINDAGTLKYGIGSVNGHRVILNADDTATATSVTTCEKILVNSSLGTDSACAEIGWFKANFDDTGGAAEDLWAVQTGVGDINEGPRPSLFQYYTPLFVALGTTANPLVIWRREGDSIYIKFRVDCGTTTAVEIQIPYPLGLISAGSDRILAVGTCGSLINSGLGASSFNLIESQGTAIVKVGIESAGASGFTAQNGSSLFSPGETISGYFKVPITAWN